MRRWIDSWASVTWRQTEERATTAVYPSTGADDVAFILADAALLESTYTDQPQG